MFILFSLHILATVNFGKVKHKFTYVIYNREQCSKTRKPITQMISVFR